MKKVLATTIAAVFVLGLALCTAARAATYTLTAVTGDVSVRMTEKGAWQAAKNNAKLEKGAAVRTSKGASAVLKSAKGNSIKIFALSNVEIGLLESTPQGGEKARMDLASGKLAASVKKVSGTNSSFNIKTPTAVAGVRGTDFYAEVSDNGASTFGVTDGEIEVTTGDLDTILSQDFTVTVEEDGEITEPAPIPEDVKEEINDALKEAQEAPAPEEESVVPPAPEEEETPEDVVEELSTEAIDTMADTLDTQTVQDITDDAEEAGEAAMETGEVQIDIYIGQPQ